MSSRLGRTAVPLAAASLASVAFIVPSAAPAGATGLFCQAWVSDSTPAQYTYVRVYVHTLKYAQVHTVAHYKTSTTGYFRKANSLGRATVPYYISSATPGYRVNVTVTVTKNGQSRTCYTSFTPHR